MRIVSKGDRGKMNVDDLRYEKYTTDEEQKFESICKRCGECCGKMDDPCENLKKRDVDESFCAIYPDRFGQRKTVSGNTFRCVSIRDHITQQTLRPNCSYRRFI